MGDQEFPVNNATMLQFDWDDVHGSPVVAILGDSEQRMNDGSLAWCSVAIVLASRAVILSVNEDTDEIIVSLGDANAVQGGAWRPVAGLQFLVGEALAWCWIGRNWRGYLDAFTLAFGGFAPDALEPRVMFVGEASSLTCHLLQPLTGGDGEQAR